MKSKIVGIIALSLYIYIYIYIFYLGVCSLMSYTLDNKKKIYIYIYNSIVERRGHN